MAFVNEFVSDEDIKKHGLDELMKKYDRWSWRDGRPSTFRHSWTVDRDRGIFAMPLFIWTEVGQSGRSQPTTKESWVVDWQGSRAIAVIDRAPSSSSRLSDSPYRIDWILADLDTSSAIQLSRESLLAVLKEALTVYGHHGIWRQVDNTVVSFHF